MRARIFWSLLVSLLLGSGIALAQVTTGTISGTINDSTGAVIPEAAVTVRNVETGISRAVTSDAAGRYRVPQLAVGTYEISAEAPGFQTTVRSGVTLTIGREATVDFSLQVGAVAERITVTGEAPLVESTKAEIAGLVDEHEIQSLPLNGRSFANLTSIQAGVLTDFHSGSDIDRGGRPFVAQGPKMSIGGARPNQASYLLDGTEITSLRYNNIPGSMAGQLLGVEGVREFTVLKSNYGAQYGRAVGGVTNVVTRSGTNEFHGSAFEFFRNSALDAKNFFNNPDLPIPPYRRNQFGASISGPIIRDKAFFMGNYEGIRQFIGLPAVSTVPTPQSRAGLGPLFGNPATPVAKNKDIDPFLALIPLPDPKFDLGNGFGQLKIFRPRPISENFGMVRYDQQLTDSDFFFARLNMSRSSVTDYGSTFVPGFSEPSTGRYYYLTLGETRILTPTLLNEFRAGLARLVNITDEIIPDLDPRLGAFPGAKLMDFSIGGGLSVAGKIGSGFQEPYRFYENTFDYSDNLIYTPGPHSITFGANLKRYRPNFYQDVWNEGVMSFTNYANFYKAGQIDNIVSLGFPGTTDPNRGWRQTYWALYMQDDYKIRPNLTVNLGLRFERITEPREVDDKVSTIRDYVNSTATTVGYPWIKIRDPLKGFAPRIGLAWTPFGDQKTVIRSGFGAFKEPIMMAHYSLYIYTKPVAQVLFLNRTTHGTIPFPYPLGTDLNALPPGSSVFVEWNGVTPHTYQWNFALERQLTESIVASATYIGSKSVHQTTSANPNQFIPYKKFDPTVGYDRWYTPASSDPDFLGRANLNFEAYRMTPWGGAASYHGLELNLKQRYARGLQYNISYTWSKNLSNVALGNEGQQGAQGSPQNWYDRDAEKGNSPLHVKHNFIASSTYDLPIGTGKTFGANWGGLPNAILGGWSINGVLRDRSGLPGTATIGGNRSRSGGVQASGSISERTDLKAGGNNNPNEGVIEVGCGSFKAGTKLGTIENWFDPCQFVQPPAGRYGNVGTYTIIGGKLFNMDFSVFKNFPVRENTNLQFRAEFFNVFNHPNFDGGGGQVITAAGNVNSNAGRINSTTTENRRIQFALKLTF